MARLQDTYRKEVAPALLEQFKFSSSMQIPRIIKVTLNMGLGEAIGNRKVLEAAAGDIKAITGQQPVITLARKSVAGFKIRDGWPIGAKVTLRRERMSDNN